MIAIVMNWTLACALVASVTSCGGKQLDLGGTASTPGDGVVASWPVADQRNPRSLRSKGHHLYWIADRGERGAVLRCEKRDCGNTVIPIVEVENTGLWGIEIHDDVLFAIDSRSILSCPTSGCSRPRIVVADAEASAVAFDDVNVYWSHRGKFAIYFCPHASCGQTSTLESGIRTDAVELAVSDAKSFWIQADDAYPQTPASIRVVPKDGSAIWSTFAGVQDQAASLTVRDGFVYWATSVTGGTIARCPSTGCSARPEIVAQSQYFPHFVDPAGEMIFWMNGATLPGDLRSVEILGCQTSDCAATMEVLDTGLGASSGTRNRTFPSRELVVDDEAIYWIGDIVKLSGPVDGGVAVVGSIRRTERRRAR